MPGFYRKLGFEIVESPIPELVGAYAVTWTTTPWTIPVNRAVAYNPDVEYALADLGLDLAGVGQELGTLLGGAYVNRFNYFDRSYKVIPQLGDSDRAAVGPLLDLKIKTPDGGLVPVSTFTSVEATTSPRTLNRFQQRNAVKIFAACNRASRKRPAFGCSKMRRARRLRRV